MKFGERNGANANAVLDGHMWERLVAPMWRAVAMPLCKGRSFREVMRALAGQHLAQAPREVGGDNRGPWVRAYCHGRDGKDYRWCAGFVSTLIAQAAQVCKVASPLPFTLGCDELADAARSRGKLTPDPKQSAAGDVFICMSGEDAFHTGIQTSPGVDSFQTIEGNSNDAGSANGYEVCARFRAHRNVRFIRLS
jgi:hypothetical protein